MGEVLTVVRPAKDAIRWATAAVGRVLLVPITVMAWLRFSLDFDFAPSDGGEASEAMDDPVAVKVLVVPGRGASPRPPWNDDDLADRVSATLIGRTAILRRYGADGWLLALSASDNSGPSWRRVEMTAYPIRGWFLIRLRDSESVDVAMCMVGATKHAMLANARVQHQDPQ